MSFRKLCGLLLALALVAGCAKNKEIAHQLAAQNLYQDVTYEHASQPGPGVVVIPGTISCANYEFLSRVKPDNLREYGELELAKAGFTVRDKNSLGEIYREIALAANLGDGSVGRRFLERDAEPPRWLVIFDVTDVKTQTTAFTFTDKNSAAVAGAMMGGMFLGAAGAQIGAGLVGSINSAKEERRWDLTLRYRILDGGGGGQIAEGTFTEQAVISSELSGFLGIDSGQSGGLTLGTVARRLVQKAVQDMDAKHKLPAVAQAAAAQAAAEAAPRAVPKAAPKSSRGKAASGRKPAPEMEAAPPDPAAPEAGKPEVACLETSLGGHACRLPVRWSTGAPPSAKEVAFAKKPELAQLMAHRRRGGEQSLIDAMVEFDILRTAGPLVTLSEPESPLSDMGRAVAITGDGLDGRVFVLSKAPSHVTPEKLVTAVIEHMRRSCVVEPLAVETVEGRSGAAQPVAVYKYIEVERKKEVQEQPDYDRDSKPQTKLISIPRYRNMAMSVFRKGGDMVLVIVIAPEDGFLPHLDGVKEMVRSMT